MKNSFRKFYAIHKQQNWDLWKDLNNCIHWVKKLVMCEYKKQIRFHIVNIFGVGFFLLQRFLGEAIYKPQTNFKKNAQLLRRRKKCIIKSNRKFTNT